jgi:ferredoxin
VEDKKEIEHTEHSIYWKVEEAAPEDETKEFWKKLRHFYRTGEKAGDEKPGTMSSALLKLLDNAKAEYPYVPRDEKAVSIELGSNTPLSMLDYLLSAHQKENRRKFKGRLSELINGLNELLKIEDKGSEANELKEVFDFADELIAFDKMVEIIPHSKHEKLSDEQVDRLNSVANKLNAGLAHYGGQEATVVVLKELEAKLSKAKLFEQAHLIEGKKDAFEHAQELITDEMHSFAELIKAYRIASLEINGEYKEEVQGEYFEHFTWHRLFEDELNLFHPVVLIVEHQYVFDHLSAYSKLLSSNLPINIIVLNQEYISVPDQRISWEDASHQFRQELATLTIAHRNVYTFQAGLDNPDYLCKGLKHCIKSTSPGICHLSLTADNATSDTAADLPAKAAKAGRYFPTIMYDPNSNEEWGGRFDISENLQQERVWPQLILKAKTSEETEAEFDVDFTYADYKACYPEKTKELMLIPSVYYTEHLVPLSEYLELDEKQLYGRIPYILLIDEQNQLHRAAIPNVWVVSCQERLDFWSYLQDLGGVNKVQVQEVLEKKNEELSEILDEKPSELPEEVKDKMEAEHQQAITKLQEEFKLEIAKIKEESMLKATERVISVLLNLGENGISLESLMALGEEESAADSSNSKDIEEKSIAAQEPTAVDVITPPQEETPKQKTATVIATPKEETVISKEAWVDSDECTSCNDCTDKYGNLFAYNEEKQAYLKDASKGTYEQLVKAAENCPAACIHPGLPLNPNETNLDKLTKRAAKFN